MRGALTEEGKHAENKMRGQSGGHGYEVRMGTPCGCVQANDVPERIMGKGQRDDNPAWDTPSIQESGFLLCWRVIPPSQEINM